jgi:nucleoside-diphosphate-sugar epimerase
LRGECYQCFLEAETTLPMIYMPDAIRATMHLMAAPAGSLRIRSAYNIDGLSFNPQELAEAIQCKMPTFTIRYQPDSRQAIAATWPQSLDDSQAQADWGWEAEIGLVQMVDDMLQNIKLS